MHKGVAPASAPSRLAADAIAAGYVRCEFFDEKGEFMDYIFVRIKRLRDADTMKLGIPFVSDRRPSSVSITY